jgi:hypothetical protein
MRGARAETSTSVRLAALGKRSTQTDASAAATANQKRTRSFGGGA